MKKWMWQGLWYLVSFLTGFLVLRLFTSIWNFEPLSWGWWGLLVMAIACQVFLGVIWFAVRDLFRMRVRREGAAAAAEESRFWLDARRRELDLAEKRLAEATAHYKSRY